MNDNNYGISIFIGIILVALFVGWMAHIWTPRCIENDCNKEQYENQVYCYEHYCEEEVRLRATRKPSYQCKMDGCTKDKGNTGFDYCPTHAKEYVEAQGYTDCMDQECFLKPDERRIYCIYHACIENDCNIKRHTGGEYCLTHLRERARAEQQSTARRSVTKKKTSEKSTTEEDPLNAKDYNDPEDFYYDNYDDFWDYEEAEDYWNDVMYE